MILIRIVKSIGVGIHTGIVEMRTHLLRSVLSVSGIMLGCAALVTMLTLIGGIEVFLTQRIGRWVGTAVFFAKDSPDPEERVAWSRSPGLRLSDGPYLMDTSDAVQYVKQSIMRRGRIGLGHTDQHSRIIGMSHETLQDEMRFIRITRGRWPSPREFDRGEKVCVLSWRVYERIGRRMHDTTDILGRYIIYNNETYEVIGIYGKGDMEYVPWYLRRSVIMPLATLQKYSTGFDPDPGGMRVEMRDPSRMQAQLAAVVRALSSRHRGAEDFQYHSAQGIEQWQRMFTNLQKLMAVISAIMLTVGGLSIMNVMLSSVSERVKEIGIRKALGARTFQIFIQFIAETVTLSVLGGLLGTLLGTAPLFFKQAITKATDGSIIPTLLTTHMLWVAGIIIAMGIAFGLYPALKAARMNPITALRYE
jgi:putative ABC transport system permease protein